MGRQAQNKCKSVTKKGKHCRNQPTIDGYCIKHWFMIIECQVEDAELPF